LPDEKNFLACSSFSMAAWSTVSETWIAARIDIGANSGTWNGLPAVAPSD
jgi:hypothetical protein